MRTCKEPCREACPVQRYLRGEDDGQLSLHDGAAAKEISVTTPNPEAVIEGACKPGAPGKPLLGFGRLACQSELVQNHFTRTNSPLYAAESALRMMNLQ